MNLRSQFCFFLFPLLLMASIEDVQRAFSSMTVEEKVGQLFMVPACPMRMEHHKKDLAKLIQDCHIGGVIVKSATPEKQVEFLRELQSISKLSLLVGIDAEWGLGMRMPNTLSFPKNLALGAIVDEEDLDSLGEEIARECRLVGAHINFAPVLDVNSQPKNPIIGVRSFGSYPKKVAKKGLFIVRGLERGKILATAKHFPGHGDVVVDPHEDLPQMMHTKEMMEKVDLVPFREAVKQNISCIMTSHMMVTAYDSVPCTFSKELVFHLLREQMHFSGLIITDALNMKALRNYFSMEEIGLKALMAGHDILLYGDHIGPNVDEILQVEVPLAYKRIVDAVQKGELSLELLDAHVLRILEAKDKLGILHKKPVIDRDLSSLSSKKALDLKKKFFRRAMTFLGKASVVYPLQGKKLTYVEMGTPVDTTFRGLLYNKYGISPSSWDSLKKGNKNSVVLVGLYSINPREKNFGISEVDRESLQKLAKECEVIGVLFGSPYAVEKLSFLSSILVAYEEEMEAQEEAFYVITGKNKAEGILPVEIKYPRK